MFRRLLTTRSLCLSGVIAALYAALTLLLMPISYGAIQCRVSEALTILPVLVPEAIPGLTVGCLIANILGSATIWDMIFGTLATLIAAIAGYLLRKQVFTKLRLPLLSAAAPVISNGVIVGLVLALTLNLPVVLTMLEVAAGEIVAVILGLMILIPLRKIDLEKLAGLS